MDEIIAQVPTPTLTSAKVNDVKIAESLRSSSSEGKIEVFKDIASATKDLAKEDKAFARVDIAKVKDSEQDVGRLLRKARKAQRSLAVSGSFDTQLNALAAQATDNEQRLEGLERSASGRRADVSAHERATHAVHAEEELVKEGKAALKNAQTARKKEERLLKKEKKMMKRMKASVASGDNVAARRYAAEVEELGDRERKAAAEATAASKAVHELERQGLRESRHEWNAADGAAWPELGHEHAKVEHDRVRLKHAVSHFKRHQKADDKKQRKLFGKLSKLSRKMSE